MGNPRKAKLSSVRRVLKIFHPEGIPWPGTAIYNAVSNTGIFQRNYELVARDILSYGLGDNILDIGTGPGWLLVKLHQEHSGLNITGLDASYSMVAKARRNMLKAGLADIIKIKKGNASNMSFPDHSFDTVVSTGSIHHWKDPTAGLNEIYRVLKHGGYALMYDLVSDTPKSVINVAAHDFGRFKMILLWLHAFEEPFYSCRDFELLARPTLFREGRIKFVGVSCCLILRKEAFST
jgi:ubiquinone/menaquinone biosynthesis C-methylase UbiE